jgi:hypothetical protein
MTFQAYCPTDHIHRFYPDQPRRYDKEVVNVQDSSDSIAP